jgi:cytochrome c556
MGQIKKGIKAGNSGQMTKGADMIADGAGKISAAFAKKDLSGKTRSLKVIWEKKSEFDEIAKTLASSAKGFKAAVKTGDKMKIQAAMKMVGSNCGKCHKMFRAKKKKK